MDTKAWILLSLQAVGALGLGVLSIVMGIWNPKTRRHQIVYWSILSAGIAVYVIVRLVTWARTP